MPVAVAAVLVACGSGSSELDAVDQPATSTADVAPPVAAETTAPDGTGAQPAPSTESAPTESASPDPVPAADVPDALRFSAPLVGGGDIELDAFAGRPVLLWFWAPW